jgi:predicted DNA-binding transcriptional regulator AlpA
MTDHILQPTSNVPGRADAGSAPLRKSEVCAELGISERTLNNLVTRKEFPPGVRIGKWAYWTRKALDNYRARAFTMQENWTPMTPGRGRLR